MTLALVPVATIEMASTISVAPVPGAGFSTMCRGVGPGDHRTDEGQQQERQGVRALRLAHERELAQQVVDKQGPRGRDLLRGRTGPGPAAG